MRITDLDKLNLVKIHRLQLIFTTDPASSKNDACFKSGQNWFENGHIASWIYSVTHSLVTLFQTLGRFPGLCLACFWYNPDLSINTRSEVSLLCFYLHISGPKVLQPSVSVIELPIDEKITSYWENTFQANLVFHSGFPSYKKRINQKPIFLILKFNSNLEIQLSPLSHYSNRYHNLLTHPILLRFTQASRYLASECALVGFGQLMFGINKWLILLQI